VLREIEARRDNVARRLRLATQEIIRVEEAA
jgi:hypothetical protein